MIKLGHLIFLMSAIALSGSQQATAQTACAKDVCVTDLTAPAATRPDRPSPSEKLASVVVRDRCRQAPVDVTAASPGQRELACSAANHALQLLSRCEIFPRRPLRVEIMDEVRHPLGHVIFGLFDAKEERVLVTDQANIRSLVEDTPYAVLPERDFYESLIVHEVVHAVMHQNLKRPVTSHAAHEYPAYVLQIESLPPDVRDKFLGSFDQGAIGTEAVLNDSILLFDPFYFAARAHSHFKASPNGCVHLHALLEGEVPFIASLP